ncbi:MAG: hypothetical protein KDC98_19395 [Planctomycetes bacterium]|nr:hypothetical protein [Planctomycetota bacterium]
MTRPDRPRHAARSALAALLALPGCATPHDRSEPSAPLLRVLPGPVLVATHAAVNGRCTPGEDIVVTVTASEQPIVCSRTREAPPIAFLVFERRAERMAYGVYGLGLAKNPIGVCRPLTGDPIAWPDRDHAQGLAHLLTRAVAPEIATRLVAENGGEWFRPGLRVFLVLRQASAELCGAAGVDDGCGALLVAELE